MGLDSLARRGEEDARAPGCGRLARWTRAPGKRNWKAAYNPFWKLSEAGTPSFRSLCLGVSAETYLGQLSACRVALGQIPMRGRATGVNLRSVVKWKDSPTGPSRQTGVLATAPLLLRGPASCLGPFRCHLAVGADTDFHKELGSAGGAGGQRAVETAWGVRTLRLDPRSAPPPGSRRRALHVLLV